MSYPKLFLLWLALNIVCSGVYAALATFHSANAPTLLADMPPLERTFNSFYFSIITATSVGYGDIVPQGFSKVLSMLQAITALLIFAVFVTKLVSRRQDIALHEVHRMTFEGIFTSIRQGLFIVRKDFDELIRGVEEGRALTARDWENLTTAFLQAQSLIEEIPELYNGTLHDLATIDITRERLLFEAIHRTIQRIDRLISVLEKHEPGWQQQRSAMKELHSVIAILDRIMPLWRQRSPYHEVKEFEDIFGLSSQLHERIKNTLPRS